MNTRQPVIPANAVDALSNGRKVAAIKIIREGTGLGLKESKDAAEAYLAANPAIMEAYKAKTASSGRGFVIFVVVAAVLASLVYQLL